MRRPDLFLLQLVVFFISLSAHAQPPGTYAAANNLRAAPALLPVPQNVGLTNQHYIIDDSWSVITANNVKNDPAVASLTEELKERFGLRLQHSAANSRRFIRLVVKPGSVNIGKCTDTNTVAIKMQAYRVKLERDHIVMTANAPQGLFYAVQTFIQSLQSENGKTFFTGGEITDWPNMELRMIYWDDAHHLERLDVMKRQIRQASYYKINAFTLKLEGHFQFAAAKPIVEPYAYTPADLQELTDYAKAHYVELVPYLDAPAHISFILKHPEYHDLRAFPNSNYELNVLDPKADELLLGMFDNLLQANKGGKYVLLSTDEAYYVGKSAAEKQRAEQLGGNGKLLASYITRIANKLHAKGRKIIIWAEHPLTIDDIPLLPSHLINGVYDVKWAPKIKEHGIRQLIYTSIQGVEPLFPNYHKTVENKPVITNAATALTDDEQQQGDLSNGRVVEVLKEMNTAITAANADLMGVVVAGWGDAGLNPETFWLGYACGGAAGWNNNQVTAEDLASRFYNSFYGDNNIRMHRVYQLLSTQAAFWDKSWDWQAANWRTPIVGNSRGVFDIPRPAKDQTLQLLAVPSAADLSFNNDWALSNKDRLGLAKKYRQENDELMELLQENLLKVRYQQYNLQVLRSVANLCRQNLNMLLDMERINRLLDLSSNLAGIHPASAVLIVDEVLDLVKKMTDERDQVLQAVTTVWYQEWFPRVGEANGRRFLDQVDDVKDHQPVRTVDMSYLVYRQLKYPLGKWAEEVAAARNVFAKQHNLPVRFEKTD